MTGGFIEPAMPPPPGMTSNFIDPDYCGIRLLVVNCVFLPLAVISFAIRSWTRLFVVRSFRIDDYLMTMALILDIAMVAVILEMLNWGLGKHMWDVPETSVSPSFLKLNMVSAILYCAATGFTKVSVLSLYTRIFPSQHLHWMVWLLVFIAAGYSIASVLANIFSCNPIAMAWNTSITTGACIDRPAFYFVNAGLGIFTDFATVLVPIPWIRRLQMPLRQKILVGSVLSLGCFVGAVSCIRLGTIYALMSNSDLTWQTVNALLWCSVELNLGITGGCMTAIRPFVRRHFPQLLGLSGGNSHGYYPRSKQSHALGPFAASDHIQFADGGHQYSTAMRTGRDNESEEHILASAASSHGLDGITRTVEVDVHRSTSHRS